jgi:hypothetical protein
MQEFTADKTALAAAISATFDMGAGTVLYDSIIRAVDDTAQLAGNFRRAVIAITDGNDFDSINTIDNVINNAALKGVPVFIIGISGDTQINRVVLEQIAQGTGGQFFEAITAQNLATIYNQLSSLLFQNQYIISFNQLALGGNTANLTIEAASQGITGNDNIPILSCPP